MKKLYEDMLSRIPLRAIGGEEYSYECYGKNARYLDLECNATVIFDEETERIFEVTLWDTGEDAPEFIWRDDLYFDAFMDEMRKRRGIKESEETDDIVQMRMATTEDFDLVVETIRERFIENDIIEGKAKKRT
jgi:hypothetical protein